MVVSIDIGSTWTKGALLEPQEGRLVPVKMDRTPTVTDDLNLGFSRVLNTLKSCAREKKLPVLCSSSAHGGLNMAAIGVVPELTLKAARLAALSAGARLSSVFSYRLVKADLERLAASCPDIILLTGGTDGGNESYILHNARMLAESDLTAAVLYAGNRDLQDDIRDIFREREFFLAGNVLPDLNRPAPSDARGKIREIFLSRIIRGKGLQSVVDTAGSEPVPTPASVFEFLSGIESSSGFSGDFSLIDLGGATTDYYSCCRDLPDQNVIVRGIPEPDVKRTVEGDLGMRVSALAALEAEEGDIRQFLKGTGGSWVELRDYAGRISQETGSLPRDTREEGYDRILAALCLRAATRRHAGVRREVYTPAGSTWVQNGKNLRGVRTVIGTGGYLAAAGETLLRQFPVPPVTPEGEEILAPLDFRFVADRDYILPHLANAARLCPCEAQASFRELFCPAVGNRIEKTVEYSE